MSYIVLARKYRPQNFKDVVGQDPVSQTLVNAIESGRIAHAYVFSGPRGVGKTTTARILAKCLNCQKGPSIHPCDACPSCLSIAQGNSVEDVLEIDGASNRGIEQIRELRESAKYTPSSSRYRIYIIDEAHQITKDAFGALLKILEEPPSHVVFMMATTEVQKIPAPILSRCQRFSLRPISPENVLSHLKKICQAEKIKVTDDALADIVRFVEGSMRDALSLLDQALVFAPEKITTETLRDLLGLLPAQVVRNFADSIRSGEPPVILQQVNQAVQDGIDLTQLGKDLQQYYHLLLLAKAGVKDPLNLSSKDQIKDAEPYTFPTLERNIRLLSRALDDMRRSETPRAVFEINALRLAQNVYDTRELLERLEKLERKTPAPIASPSVGFQRPSAAATPARYEASRPSTPQQPSSSIFNRHPEEVAVATDEGSPVVKKRDSSPSAQNDNGSLADFLSQWDNWVDEISQSKSALGAALGESIPEINGNTLVLTLANSFSQQMIERSMDTLKSSLSKRVTGPIGVELRMSKPSEKPAVAATTTPSIMTVTSAKAIQDEAKSNLEEVAADGVGADIQKALKHFPGALKREKPA